MNREIKFRGRAINGDKQWVYGGILPMYRGVVHILPTFGSFVQVDPSTVGQFTGLHDADGREVYEGDIVLGYWNSHYRDVYGRVEFRNGAFKAKIELLGSTGITSDFSRFRVIGTIHDPQPENDE